MTTDNTTPTHLAKVRSAAKKAADWRTRRDDLIRDSVAAGIAQRKVADAAGLNQKEVWRIVQRGEREATS